MTVTSTSARRSALVPKRPPKPEPITTTWCRAFVFSVFTSDITIILPTCIRGHPILGRSLRHIRARSEAFRHDGEVTHYDLAVIGTGSGNSIVDDRFADWRVAIIEDNLFGGTCLNVGCIPTKMFVYPADLARDARHGPALGVDSSYDGADWPAIRDRIFARIDPIVAGGKRYREGLLNVDVYSSHATFVDDRTLSVATDGQGSGEQITADQIVIAAGSRVDVAPIPGLDDVDFH